MSRDEPKAREFVRVVLDGLPAALAMVGAVFVVVVAVAYLPYVILPLMTAAAVVFFAWTVGDTRRSERELQAVKRAFDEKWGGSYHPPK